MTVQQGAATFAGAGNLSPRTTSKQQTQVRLTGAGNLRSNNISRQQIGAHFAGRGMVDVEFVASAIARIAWPDTLPQCPILNGFSEQKQTNVVAFSPDVGPPKMRRRSTGASWNTSVAYRMTTSELADFNNFYEDDLADGTLPFTWSHPVQQTVYYWIFDPKESPKIDRVTPGTFRVTFNLLRIS